jgi:predicted nucleic acid-binding protein
VKVLDSDTCIGILRGRTEVLDRRAAEQDEVVTTWITASELFYGAAKSVQPEANAALVVQFLLMRE